MRVQSVRQSLLIYAVVVSLALGFAITTLASKQMLSASQQAEHEAARRELRVLIGHSDKASVDSTIKTWNQKRYEELVIITKQSTGHSITWAEARKRTLRKKLDTSSSLIVLALPGEKQSYLLARLKPKDALQKVQSRIRLLLIATLIAAVLAGVLLGFLNNRIVLRPLSSLSVLASDGELESFNLDSEAAPNEIAQVAQSFRRTVRRLQEEQTQLEEKHRELHAAQEGLNRASKLASLGRIAAGVAHEIGNPLAAVKGYLSLLKRGLEPKEQEEVVDRCVTELDRIHETIRQLLTYARRNEDSKQMLVFTIGDTIDDVLKLLSNHPELKGVEVQVEGVAKHQAYGLPEAFRQVVLNIVLNAGQALRGMEAPTLRVWAEDSEQDVLLHFEDNGPGIPGTAIDQIFDPFFTTKDPGEGTGLGLAVSRSLMEGMGGKLSCLAKTDQGAQFTLSMPHAKPESSPSV